MVIKYISLNMIGSGKLYKLLPGFCIDLACCDLISMRINILRHMVLYLTGTGFSGEGIEYRFITLKEKVQLIFVETVLPETKLCIVALSVFMNIHVERKRIKLQMYSAGRQTSDLGNIEYLTLILEEHLAFTAQAYRTLH